MAEEENEEEKLTPEEWLAIHDKELWVKRPSVREARDACSEATGEKISLKRFRELRMEVCHFWGYEKFKPAYRKTTLTRRQWEQVSGFLRRHWDTLQHESEEFLIRLMRTKKLPVNEQVLRNSSTYQHLKGSK